MPLRPRRPLSEIASLVDASDAPNELLAGDWTTAYRYALQALEEARQDQTDAVCTWQIAQRIAPILALADLSAHGPAAEELMQRFGLESDRWPLRSVGRPSGVRSAESPIYVGGDVRPPVKIRAPRPQYTERARKEGIQGVVIVQATIDRWGCVTNVQVLKGLSQELDRQAMKAIMRWRFEPATLDGQPVDVYYNLTINFRLK